MSVQPKPGGATTILVFGILGIICCPIFAILAWVQGNSYLKQCRAAGVEPEGTATVGRILGMVGVGLWVLGIIIQVILLAMGVSFMPVQNLPGPNLPAPAAP